MTNFGIVDEDNISLNSVCHKNYNMPPVIPIHAHWDITNGCNFRCVFCLSSSGVCSPNELTFEEGITLIDKLYDAGIVFLKVLGGEPFYRDDTLALFKYAAKKGMVLSFSTNASLVSEEVAETLSQIKNSIIYIQMSLYGENKERYKQVTGSEENFDRAINGLKLMLDKGLDVSILTVVTEENSNQIADYFNIAKSFRVKEFRITPKIGIGRASKGAEDGTYCDTNIWPNLIRELRKIKDSLSDTDPKIYMDARPLLGSYLFDLTNVPYFWQNCCSAANMIYIDPTGKAAPCPFLKNLPTTLKKIYQNVSKREEFFNKSFEDVWNSEVFRNFRDYYEPEKNPFKINTNCKFYKDGSCTPCVATPCNCTYVIREIKSELEKGCIESL